MKTLRQISIWLAALAVTAGLLLITVRAIGASAPPVLPDPKLTPGATLKVSLAKLCVKGYAGDTRNVTESEKNKVYSEYGIMVHPAGAFEVDHLISLELGGSNDIKNLWPQTYSGEWNAHVKDKLEDHLHSLVCSGAMSLPDAQKAISSDWIKLYKAVFKSDHPL